MTCLAVETTRGEASHALVAVIYGVGGLVFK